MFVAAQLAGRQIGDFRLVELLDRGGMGEAYRAEQLSLGREAVVKLIALERITPEAKVRFLREARLASQLDHPYAAHVYAFGAESDGLLWIAMELVRGLPLNKLIADDGPMPLGRFVPFFDRLCEVVFSAHSQGIIHRDIKPSNVMVVRRAGRLLPKLLDFGIARGASIEPDDRSDPVGATEIPDSPLTAGSRSVTLRGRLVGSPHYMAPEQWVDATGATARTDLYALAVTAYEVLTGAPPFTGATVLEIARAHSKGVIRPVGSNLPPALDQVFARALAKREADRYATVLELSAAIRETARSVTRDPSIDLDEVVRDTFIQAGPQPLAEALMELAAAGDPATAWEAGWRVVSVLVRVLGMVALAARARFGERSGDETVLRRVRALIDRGLDLDEWVALEQALLEPFAERAQTHPVPELVEAFWAHTQPRKPFDRLLATRRADVADAIDRDAVRALLTELGQALRGCAFLTDYLWSTGNGELWTGPRRTPRERRPLKGGGELSENGFWLNDADATPVLELSPLVQPAPPSPGHDDELFLLDGPAKRGARMVAWPREFERYDEDVRKFVDRQLAQLTDSTAKADQDAAPFRGLAAFGPNDASRFFGREREVEAVVNRLRIHPMIAVVGPSGVGKSSFVHAGVLPALPDTWQTLSIRPGISPLAALETRLLAAGFAASNLAEQLAVDPDALGAVLEANARRQGARLVLVIDQLEEMFTQCRDVAMRDQFARAIVAAGSRGEHVRVIATLRDDFLVRAAELPGLGQQLTGALELVTLPDPPTLRRILVEPLRQVGYRFETDAMPDQMVAAVREHPGALALLSFAASKLWDLRDRSFRQIPHRAYEAIGGVAGALAQHAEETLSALPEAEHALVRELFRHLVTSEGTRAALRRDEAIELLGKGAAAERVIELLVERRLLTGYEGDGKTDWIEVVHEALLSAWPRLVTWQREDAEGARLRDQVRAAARQWGERGRPKGLLWRGEALVEYRLWRARHRAALTDVERDFAEASIADETRTRRVRRFALAAVLAGLSIGIVVLQRASTRAERNAEDSRRTALASLVEQGRAAAVGGRPQDAIVFLSAAYSEGAKDPNLAFLLAAAEKQLGGQVAVLRGHTAGVKTVESTPDGAHIVTASLDNKVRIWSARTWTLEHEFTATGEQPSPGIAIAPNGDVLTFGYYEAPTMRDITGVPRFTLNSESGAIARLGQGGKTIVTLGRTRLSAFSAVDGSPRGSAQVDPSGWLRFEVDDERYAVVADTGVIVGKLDFAVPPHLIETSVGGVSPIALGGHGRWLAVVPDPSREVRIWDLDHPEVAPRIISGHAGDVIAMRFSPDGARLATGDLDHSVKVWDVDSARLVASLDGHEGYVVALAWSPDGHRIATGSIDRTARLWNADTGAALAVFYGHADVVYHVAFDPSGDHVLTASYDSTAGVFDARRSERAVELNYDGPISLRFTPDAKRLLAVGAEGIAWLIDVPTRSVVRSWKQRRYESRTARLIKFSLRVCGDISADGDHVLIPARDLIAIVTANGTEQAVLKSPAGDVSCARFASNGGVIAGTSTGHVVIWDAALHVERMFQPSQDRITDLELDANGRIATASDDGSAVVSDATGHVEHTFRAPTGTTKGVAFGHHVPLLATANQDTVARVYDLTSGKLLVASHSLSDLNAVDFSADDRRIAVANTDGTATMYDANDGRTLAHYEGGAGWVGAVAMSPVGDLLAIGDNRGRVQLVSVASETRPPAEIAREVECTVPLKLVGTHLIATPVPVCR